MNVDHWSAEARASYREVCAERDQAIHDYCQLEEQVRRVEADGKILDWLDVLFTFDLRQCVAEAMARQEDDG